ncbi:hypothetical protein IE53DRAFT_225137 [Violaceomyces palustris]|uniref:Uncharacterized protein n=1 Tax=Violaceomyces palustris TaxID=1673888 RepID=A0ACD0NQ21_9BASI|nr:hypothetical protein IE53DRAFT_225137 [Violaceomyces palustris]
MCMHSTDAACMVLYVLRQSLSRSPRPHPWFSSDCVPMDSQSPSSHMRAVTLSDRFTLLLILTLALLLAVGSSQCTNLNVFEKHRKRISCIYSTVHVRMVSTCCTVRTVQMVCTGISLYLLGPHLVQSGFFQIPLPHLIHLTNPSDAEPPSLLPFPHHPYRSRKFSSLCQCTRNTFLLDRFPSFLSPCACETSPRLGPLP